MYCFTGTVTFKGQSVEVEDEYCYDPAEYLDGYKVYDEGCEVEILNTYPDFAELTEAEEDELYEIVSQAALEDYHRICEEEYYYD